MITARSCSPSPNFSPPGPRARTRPGKSSACKHDPALKDWSTDDPGTVNLGVFPLIGYVGPPGTFPRLSFRRFLRPEAETDPEIRNLKDKVVIIAYEPAALQDIHPTPYSLSLWKWQGNDMSGAELHANIVETLLTGRFPRPVPGYLSALYLAAMLLAGGFLFFRLSSWRGLAAALLLCLAGRGLGLPPVPPLLAAPHGQRAAGGHVELHGHPGPQAHGGGA